MKKVFILSIFWHAFILMSGNINLAFASNSDLDSASEFYNLWSAPLNFFPDYRRKGSKSQLDSGSAIVAHKCLSFKKMLYKRCPIYLFITQDHTPWQFSFYQKRMKDNFTWNTQNLRYNIVPLFLSFSIM